MTRPNRKCSSAGRGRHRTTRETAPREKSGRPDSPRSAQPVAPAPTRAPQPELARPAVALEWSGPGARADLAAETAAAPEPRQGHKGKNRGPRETQRGLVSLS